MEEMLDTSMSDFTFGDIAQSDMQLDHDIQMELGDRDMEIDWSGPAKADSPLFVQDDRVPTSDIDAILHGISNDGDIFTFDTSRLPEDIFDDFDLSNWQSHADQTLHPMELRPGVRDEFGQSYVTNHDFDLDETGDYDPTMERQRYQPRKRRQGPAQGVDANDLNESDEDSVDFIAQQAQRALRLEFPHTKEKFSALIDAIRAREVLQNIGVAQGYEFRPRTVLEQEAQNEDTRENHLGHPAARGCVTCLELGTRCTLLDNEFDWPCSHCAEEDEHCVLVIPSAKLQSCNGCTRASKKEKWLVCSHLYTDESGPCLRCTTRSLDCHAGPDSATVRQRTYIGEDGLPFQNTRPECEARRIPKTCQACQEAGRHCSFDDDSDGTVCIGCEISGTRCLRMGVSRELQSDHTEPDTPQSKKHQKSEPKQHRAGGKAEAAHEARRNELQQQMHQHSTQMAIRYPAEQRVQRPPRVAVQPVVARRSCMLPPPRQSMLLKIKTKFCHPMSFNYEDFESDDDCHFCRFSEMPIIGLEQKEVLVRPLPNGKGYEEVRGGHAADGITNTKICTMCTLDRMQIIACHKHQVRRLDKWNAVTLQAAIGDLLAGQNKQRWCSICCNIARYECCAAQSGNLPGASTGCGLLLCELCTVVLGAFDDDLDKMLGEIEDQVTAARPLGLRADYDLLKKNGLLMQYIMNEKSI